MAWELLRAVVVKIDKPEDAPTGFEATIGVVRVRTTVPLTIDGQPAGVLTIASTPIATLDVGEPVVIPDAERRLLEEVLEALVRVEALEYWSTHSISSPDKYVGLRSTDDDEGASLEGAVVEHGISSRAEPFYPPAGILREHISELDDRWDGVALLAEALNSPSAFGAYTHLIRLFERAFGVGPGELTPLLETLLSSTPFDFTPSEVNAWTAARAPAFHADRRETFYLERDVAPLVPRMRDAGYEVLMNKLEWRSKSVERRPIWRPLSGTLPNGSFFATQGMVGGGIRAQFRDGFDSYPLLLAGPVDEALPRALWVQHSDSGAVLQRSGCYTA